MPKGYQGAKKAGEFSGSGFHRRPSGINYFALSQDGQQARVRFCSQHEDIEWVRKWRLPPSANFRFGELVNCIDQHDDGTQDPGYAAGLRTSFKAYPILIWRNAPVYARDNQGRYIKDGLGNRQLIGYADRIAVWECSYRTYNALQTLDAQYGGLMSRDFTVTRKGLEQKTDYLILPNDPTPLTQQDQQLIMTERIELANFVEIPSFQDLAAYINGGVMPEQQQGFAQQAQTNQQAGGMNPFTGTQMPPAPVQPAPTQAQPGFSPVAPTNNPFSPFS